MQPVAMALTVTVLLRVVACCCVLLRVVACYCVFHSPTRRVPCPRVRGVSRLRVVDASIMPLITAANTAAPALMIGEKGASFIIGDMGRKGLPLS